MDELLQDFLAETGDNLEAAGAMLVGLEQETAGPADIAGIFRLVHTIKGTCGFLGLDRLEKLAHATEALVGRLRDGAMPTQERVSIILAAIDQIKVILAELDASAAEPPGNDTAMITRLERAARDEGEVRSADTALALALAKTASDPAEAGPTDTPGQQTRKSETIRVAVPVLERMMTLVSELVLTRNQLNDTILRQDTPATKLSLQRLSSLVSDLQNGVMRARMQPLGRLFGSVPRILRDLRLELGKEIDLVVTGADTELDRQLIEIVRDPLTHIIRNCADHGIETPAQRLAVGKRSAGTIRISAAHEAGSLVIQIADDGRGLDVPAIRNKAVARGLIGVEQAEAMDDTEICRFIFAAGFTTANAVTTVSGRGVGMDVVRENIESIGGSVSMLSTVGQGTTFVLKIPLTLAIAPALLVHVGTERFALPQHVVVEVLSLKVEDPRLLRVHGKPTLNYRDEVLPVVDVAEVFAMVGGAARTSMLAIVMRIGNVRLAILVDAVSDVQEIVVKPLSVTIKQPIFSGNTILGDGSVVLILDGAGLAATAGLHPSNDYSVAKDPAGTFEPEQAPTRMVLFRAGQRCLKALPLSLIVRLESVDVSQIQIVDGMPVMTHRGQLMPLVPADPSVKVNAQGQQPVLVISVGGEPMGLFITEIVDIVEVSLSIGIPGTTPGVIGVADIAGEPAEIVDIAHFMQIARPSAYARGHSRKLKVLLVDDKQFFLDMLAPVVSAAGHKVIGVTSAREALSLFDKGAVFDVVVTDTDMPDMDGYAFARALAANPKRADVPIVAMAAFSAPAITAAANAAGMRCAIGKFDRRRLLSTLADVLEAGSFHTFSLENRVLQEGRA